MTRKNGGYQPTESSLTTPPPMPKTKPPKKEHQDYRERVSLHVIDGLFEAFGSELNLDGIGALVKEMTDDIVKEMRE